MGSCIEVYIIMFQPMIAFAVNDRSTLVVVRTLSTRLYIYFYLIAIIAKNPLIIMIIQ
jgi:hypothetical protein